MSTLKAEAELNVYQVAALKPVWLSAYAQGAREVDLSGVLEIDASGVQLLAALWRMGRRDGTPVRFTEPSAVVQDALELLGAQRLLEAAPVGEEAPDA